MPEFSAMAPYGRSVRPPRGHGLRGGIVPNRRLVEQMDREMALREAALAQSGRLGERGLGLQEKALTLNAEERRADRLQRTKQFMVTVGLQREAQQANNVQLERIYDLNKTQIEATTKYRVGETAARQAMHKESMAGLEGLRGAQGALIKAQAGQIGRVAPRERYAEEVLETGTPEEKRQLFGGEPQGAAELRELGLKGARRGEELAVREHAAAMAGEVRTPQKERMISTMLPAMAQGAVKSAVGVSAGMLALGGVMRKGRLMALAGPKLRKDAMVKRIRAAAREMRSLGATPDEIRTQFFATLQDPELDTRDRNIIMDALNELMRGVR